MTFTSMWRKVMNSLRKERVSDGDSNNTPRRFKMQPFTLKYAFPRGVSQALTPYHFDPARQLNMLPDGRPAVSDPDLLLAAGTTTSTAGSATHFDD
jgi:putative ATP-grasp target RiPP